MADVTAAQRGLRAYRAEDAVSALFPAPPLDGTQRAAQAYVDRITRSAWWRRNCPPSWRGDESGTAPLSGDKPPRRVIVRLHPKVGATAYVNTLRRTNRGRYFPWISLGTKPWQQTGLSSAQDPWVILHELAHVMAASAGSPGGREAWHGREFARCYVLIVRRWLGAAQANALRDALRAEGLLPARRARAADRP